MEAAIADEEEGVGGVDGDESAAAAAAAAHWPADAISSSPSLSTTERVAGGRPTRKVERRACIPQSSWYRDSGYSVPGQARGYGFTVFVFMF